MPQCRQICTFTADLRVGFRAPLRHSAHTDGPFPPVTTKNLTRTGDGARAVGNHESPRAT
jgi:hypothetical protein